MAQDYADIYGKRVKEFTDDPTLNDTYEGQVWYNSTTGTLKSVVSFAAWRSGINAPFNVVAAGATGPQTSNLIFSGYGNPASPPGITTTAEYNGSGWTVGGNMGGGEATYISAAGTQTAGLGFAGLTPAGTGNRSDKTEEYNGTSWSEENVLNNRRGQAVGIGLQTAAICATGDGGAGGGGDYVNYVENYNGTSWTAGTAVNLGKRVATGNGTQTSAIIIAGNVSPGATLTDTTEEWNGSSWTSGGSVNTARKGGMAAGANADSSVFFGGTAGPGVSTATEDYDGSTWSTSPATMGTAVTDNQQGGGANVNTAAIVVGGPTYTATQEYNKSINTITPAAWSSGGDLNTARNGMGTSGTQTAGLAAGGNLGPSKVDNSEEYDGTSWTEGNNLNTARGELAAAGNSPQTASLVFGGTTSSTPDNPGITNASEEYDGTSWTSGNNMNYSSRNLGGFGIQTSALAAGGLGPPTYLATTGEYDGTNWTAGTSLPSGLQDNQGMTGASQTSGIVAGGEGTPGSATSATLEYDGSTWTAGGSLATAVYGNGAAGIQTAALSFGGNSDKTATEGYDGTSWSSRPSLATGRNRLGGAGTNVAAIAVGGLTTPGTVLTATEEFTGETFVLDYKTLTSS